MAQPDVQQTNVSPAFLNPPSTAAMFRQQFADSPAGQAVAQQNPPAQPQNPTPPAQPDNQIFVPGPRQTNPILPAPNSQATQQPQVATPPLETPGQSDAPTSVSPPTALSSDVVLQRQLEAERQAWAAERTQWQAAVQKQNEMLQQAAATQKEYDQLKQQAELTQKLSSDELFANMSTVDADDARQIVQLTAQTLQAPLDSMRQEMQKQQAELAKQQQYINEQMFRMRQERAANEVYTVHPDFPQLAVDPNFLQFARQRDGYTSKTREQIAWEEFNAGNPGYVINLVNEYKGKAPKPENVQTVPPVQVANSTTTAVPQTPTAVPYTLAELNSMMQMRQISPEQYREGLNALRAAQSMQPPR